MSAIYETRDLEQRYQQRTALPKLSLTIESGEAVALTGPNGCGKSTLLRLLAFIERPFSGELLYYGDRNNPRREVSLLLQDPYLLRASVFYNVTLGLRLRHRREQLESIYERCMRAVGFADPRSFAARGPNALSGGERQRVALAARLALNPRVLLLDEPTSNVDAASARAIAEAVTQCRRDGVTVVCSTHDPALIDALQAREIRLGRRWDEI